MRALIIGLVALAVLISGCTLKYRPTEYVIGADRIAGFSTGTPVRIIGEPSPTDYQVIMGSASWISFVTNYNDVTATLAAQLTKEMTKRGQPVSDSASKTIRLKVLKLGAIRMGYITEGSMLLSLQLGAAQHLSFLIYNSTPGTLDRAMDGTIARAVMQILSDPKVLAFLADMPVGNPS